MRAGFRGPPGVIVRSLVSGDSDQIAGSSWDAQGHDFGHDLGMPGGAVELINRGSSLLDSLDYPGAEATYRSAMASGDPEHAPLAAIYLGEFLDGPMNDKPGAISACQLAISSGHPEWGPAAASRTQGDAASGGPDKPAPRRPGRKRP
jgi:hypothetical protein